MVDKARLARMSNDEVRDLYLHQERFVASCKAAGFVGGGSTVAEEVAELEQLETELHNRWCDGRGSLG